MLVATHKAVSIPSDSLYVPIHVGHALNPVNIGYQPDSEGANISSLNRSYCELTALYWAWRNLDCDAVGLSHYRRYFVGDQTGPNGTSILSAHEAADLLRTNDVVLARRRNYVIETIDSHYRHAHHGTDLDALKRVLGDLEPKYIPAYETVFGGRSLSLYNMFLMRKELFDQYSSWLFPILSSTSDEIGDESTRSAYQQRTLGYIGERLLNIWITAHPELKVAHRKVVNTDGERRIAKAVNLAKRKIAR